MTKLTEIEAGTQFRINSTSYIASWIDCFLGDEAVVTITATPDGFILPVKESDIVVTMRRLSLGCTLYDRTGSRLDPTGLVCIKSTEVIIDLKEGSFILASDAMYSYLNNEEAVRSVPVLKIGALVKCMGSDLYVQAIIPGEDGKKTLKLRSAKKPWLAVTEDVLLDILKQPDSYEFRGRSTGSTYLRPHSLERFPHGGYGIRFDGTHCMSMRSIEYRKKD